MGKKFHLNYIAAQCVEGKKKISKLENKICPYTSTSIKENDSGLYNKNKPSTRDLGNLEFFFSCRRIYYFPLSVHSCVFFLFLFIAPDPDYHAQPQKKRKTKYKL